jgi:signal recognition particle subunit SEC65
MKDIIIALKKHRLSYQVEEKPHPGYWWKGDGRAIVTHTGSKQALLCKLAKDIIVKEEPGKSHRFRLKRAKKGEKQTTSKKRTKK